MNTLIKRSSLLGTLFVLTMFSQAVMAQTTLDLTLTVDNEYSVYLSDSASDPTGTSGRLIGTDDDWPIAESYLNEALIPGVPNYIHVVGTNTGGPAAFLGQFTLSNADYEFANGTQSLLTSAEPSEGWKAGLLPPPALLDPLKVGDHGDDPWGVITGISVDADWIWLQAEVQPDVVLFTAEILPTADIALMAENLGDEPVIPGSVDSWHVKYTATNNGPGTATNIAITHVLTVNGDLGSTAIPADCSLFTADGTFDLGGGTWDIASLDAGASAVVEATCTIAADAADGTTVDWAFTLASLDQSQGDNTGEDGPVETNTTFSTSQFFEVTKNFTDTNPNDVTVSIACNTGLILDQDFDLADGEKVVFQVENFINADGFWCEITETNTAGYVGSFVANGGTPSLTSCYYTGGAMGGMNTCAITNTPDYVDVTVGKEWFTQGAGGNDIDMNVSVDVRSAGMIQGGGPCLIGPLKNDGPSLKTEINGVDYCKIIDFDGENPADVVVKVMPVYAGTDVYLTEIGVDQYVEVDNTCGTGQIGMVTVKPDMDASCTFTNTVFFEGIPTLNQYGLAIMALLMLGIGFVGFRRFV